MSDCICIEVGFFFLPFSFYFFLALVQKKKNDGLNFVKYEKWREGPTRIRTGVVRIRTESDNHYTIGPFSSVVSVH